MSGTKVVLAPGDACLVVRKSGDLLLAYPEGDTEGEPTLIVMGLAKALDNEAWVRGLVERVKATLV